MSHQQQRGFAGLNRSSQMRPTLRSVATFFAAFFACYGLFSLAQDAKKSWLSGGAAESSADVSSSSSSTDSIELALAERQHISSENGSIYARHHDASKGHSSAAVTALITTVDGSSMEPNLSHGDKVRVSLEDTDIKELKRGDIVVYISPEKPEKRVIKRVIGLQGDRVQLMRSPQDVSTGSYMAVSYASQGDIITVPRGHIWLQGDNPSRSRDSSDYGPVPMGLVFGKATHRLPSHAAQLDDDAKQAKLWIPVNSSSSLQQQCLWEPSVEDLAARQIPAADADAAATAVTTSNAQQVTASS